MKKLVLILLVGIANADVNTAVDKFFQSLTPDVGVNGPTIVHNQSAGIVSLGGVSTRSQSVQLDPIRFTAPSYQASCGNINFFTGSVSFMTDVSQLIEFVENTLATAAITSAVTALKAISPNLAGTLQSMFDASQKALGMFNNSCQLGMALGNIASSSIYDGIAKARSNAYGDNSDASGAEIKSSLGGGSSGNLTGKLKEVSASYQKWVNENAIMNPTNDKLVASTIPDKYGSIIWKGMQALRLYSLPIENSEYSDIANLIISLTGDIVIYSPKDDGVGTALYVIPPTIKDIKQFMTKNAPDTKVYNCTYFNTDHPGECTNAIRNLSNPKYPTIDYRGGIIEKIQRAMKDIQDHFQNNKTLSPDDMLIISISPIPIFAVAQTLNDIGMGSFINNYLNAYTPQISFEILQKLINMSLALANQASNQRWNKDTEQAINMLSQNILNLQNQLNSYAGVYKTTDPVKLLQELDYLKGYAQNLLSPELMQKVNFIKQLGSM